MKKVYIISMNSVYEFETTAPSMEAYATKESALARFNELKQAAIKNGWVHDDWVVTKSDYIFSSYEEGRYCESHFDLTLDELEINQ